MCLVPSFCADCLNRSAVAGDHSIKFDERHLARSAIDAGPVLEQKEGRHALDAELIGQSALIVILASERLTGEMAVIAEGYHSDDPNGIPGTSCQHKIQMIGFCWRSRPPPTFAEYAAGESRQCLPGWSLVT